MKKVKNFLTSPKVSLGAFVLAVALLGFSSIGGARAALTYYSDNYVSRVQMQDIGVTLLENGNPVSGDEALLQNLVNEEDGEKFKLGMTYPEALSVQNTGSINEYVRVTIYKYWLDESGKKIQTLSPDLIDLNLTGNGWVEDTDPQTKTDERTVLYYTSVLPAGATASPLSDTLTVKKDVAAKVKQVASEDGTVKTVYEYDGAKFCVEAKVDAVQEHNAQDAILSAWGRTVTVSGGNLSLN